MIKKDYRFPYDLGDGAGYAARWEDDVLSMTFLRYYTDENIPNEIEVKFHGVEWMRTTCFVKYPCSDEEWDIYGYDPEKPIEEYLLVKREWFNDDYEEFMSGNGFGLNTVRCLDDNVVFIDDRIIFSCTDIEIVRAVAEPDVCSAFETLTSEYRKKYRA